MNTKQISETGFLRLNQVLQVFPVCTTAWWNGVKSGKYPQSVKLSPRTTAWRVEDIKALIESYNKKDNEDKGGCDES